MGAPVRALFVSDIHISHRRDPRADLFLSLLQRLQGEALTHLFLVGDIFDLWIANRSYFVREYSEIIEALKTLRARGVEIHYFEGNHDLDLGIFWQKELGFIVHECAQYFRLGDMTVRVEHGDEMDPSDRGYLFLRWLLRTPVMVWAGRHLPDFVVSWIGRRMSAVSRTYTTSDVKSVSDEVAREKVRAHARRAFAAMPFDIFVSGHVHVVEDSVQTVEVAGPGSAKESRNFRCVNLGTWLKDSLVFEVS
jgi:UDP-2,3-diacylglucosamine hydrolase